MTLTLNTYGSSSVEGRRSAHKLYDGQEVLPGTPVVDRRYLTQRADTHLDLALCLRRPPKVACSCGFCPVGHMFRCAMSLVHRTQNVRKFLSRRVRRGG